MAFFGPNYSSQQTGLMDTLNPYANRQMGNAQNIYGQLDPALMNQLNNPGYTQSQQSALTAGALQPISSGYSSAAQNLGRIGARTNNTAGIVSGQDALARQGAAAMGTAGNQVQTQIANNAQQQKEQAMAGLGNLYGQNLSSAENLYGTSAGIANKPTQPSTFSDILAGIGAGAGIATGVSDMSGGGSGAGLFSYAKGGPVRGKRPIIVGERGEELFVPPGKGRIIPHARTERMLGNPYA